MYFSPASKGLFKVMSRSTETNFLQGYKISDSFVTKGLIDLENSKRKANPQNFSV